jgi:hypothetical protein
MTIANQPRYQIDHEVRQAVMSSVLNLGDGIELVINRLHDGLFPQQYLVPKEHQPVFHVSPSWVTNRWKSCRKSSNPKSLKAES